MHTGMIVADHLDNKHDGDMYSANCPLTQEAMQEVLNKLNDPIYYLSPTGGFIYSAMTEIVERVINNVTE